MAKRKTPQPVEPAQAQPQKLNTDKSRSLRIMIPIMAIILFLVIYLLRMDRVVGMFNDDGWYALLGKALATGHGYTLINSPTQGIFPLYPPAYPFLLSLVFRIAPQFPQNLWLLKSVSIIAMLLAGAATYFYFVRYRHQSKWIALALAVATALNPGLVFLATSSLMSECVFTLAQMLTIIAVEHCVANKEGDRFRLFALLAGAFASFAFLTRSMAAGLILAALIYFVKERMLKTALVFAAATAVMAGSWTLYSRAHQPTPEQKAEVNSYIVRPYTEQFWDRLAGHESAGSISIADLPARSWNNLSSFVASDAGGMLLPALFPSLNQGLGERGNVIQLLLSLLAFGLIVTGFISVVREKITYAEIAIVISLAIILLWPFPPYRFLLPSLPLLIFYFLMGAKVLLGLHLRFAQVKAKESARQGLLFIAGALAMICIFGNGLYLSRKYAGTPAERPKWVRTFDEYDGLLKWTSENVSKSDVVVTPNPPLTYLLTGNKTTTFEDPAENWANWNRMGVRYLVHLSPSRLGQPDAAESKYRIVHRGEGELNLRVVDLGSPSSRLPWGGSVAPTFTPLDSISR